MVRFFDEIAIAGERYLGKVVGPFFERRHRRTLRRGAVDPEAARRARASWWGSDPRWYPGGTPPRAHNHVTPLIDGEAFFTALHDAIVRAQEYVFIAGWCLTPAMPLIRGTRAQLVETRLLDVLSATAQRVPVRILLWGGSALLTQPSEQQMEDAAETLNGRATGDLLCRLDESAPRTHCHHQKAVIVDGRIAFIGGFDLTTLEGDRWDRPAHELRAGVNWHDVAVRLEGEAVPDVEENFRERWAAVTTDTLPARATPAIEHAWNTPAQVVRTIPRKRYGFAPDGEFGIHYAYLAAIAAARSFIYLETQYCWSPDIVAALRAVIQRPPSPSFRVVLVLPAQAASGRWDNDEHVKQLLRADAGRGIFRAYSLFASGPASGLTPFRYRPVYVHAKVAIIDDEWFTVGSANLNNRGFVTDSELNVVVREPALARTLRADLWAEHLGRSREEILAADPIELIDWVWPQLAIENEEIVRQGELPLSSKVHRYEIGRKPGATILEGVEVASFEH